MFLLFLFALSKINAKPLADKAPVANPEGEEQPTPEEDPLVEGEDYGWTTPAIATLAVTCVVVLCIIIALIAFFGCKKPDEENITEHDIEQA